MSSFSWWDSEGKIPYELDNPDLSNQSPYRISLLRLVRDFGYTPARRALLANFLEYRTTLHQAGIMRGFQWVNGSFVENIEQTEIREPNDIDVVTFFQLPDGFTERTFITANVTILDPDFIKSKYRVDAQHIVLDPENDYSTYSYSFWHNFWSYDRYGRRKGYLEIDLSANEEDAAAAAINSIVD